MLQSVISVTIAKNYVASSGFLSAVTYDNRSINGAKKQKRSRIKGKIYYSSYVERSQEKEKYGTTGAVRGYQYFIIIVRRHTLWQ